MTFRLSQTQIQLIINSLECLKADFDRHMYIQPPSLDKTIEEFKSCDLIMDDIPKEQRYVYLFIGRRPVG